jgi:predicted membrane channel-forming protein YqfA (hemolysin III family)
VPGSDYILGGPLFWVTTAVLFGSGMLAVFVVIDAVRRAKFPGSKPAEPLRWVYIIPQGALVVLMLLGQVRAVPVIVTGVVVILTPLVLAQGIAYLLRVVFPKQPWPAPAEDAEEFELLADGGDTMEPESAPPVHHASQPAAHDSEGASRSADS